MRASRRAARPRQWHRFAASIALGLSLGCDSFGPDDVSLVLETDRTRYQMAAELIRVTVHNASPGTVYVGDCAAPEVRHAGEWVPVEHVPGYLCSLIQRVLRPGESTVFTAVMDPLPPAEYRLRLFDVVIGREKEERVDGLFVTNPFTVEPDAE